LLSTWADTTIPFPAADDNDRRVLALLASGRQTSYWIFEHSDLTLGEIQTALVRLHDANLVVREVGHGRKQVFWSRAPGTLAPDTP
jgi:hypothetical protein